MLHTKALAKDSCGVWTGLTFPELDVNCHVMTDTTCLFIFSIYFFGQRLVGYVEVPRKFVATWQGQNYIIGYTQCNIGR